MSHSAPADQRILDLIAAYGADPQSWPDDERSGAQAAIERQPDLYAEALSEARLLDSALSLNLAPEPAISLFEDVLRAAPRAKPKTQGAFSGLFGAVFPNGVRWPAGAALASLAMGLVGGYAYAATGLETYTDTEQAYIDAFGYDTYEGWLSEEGQE